MITSLQSISIKLLEIYLSKESIKIFILNSALFWRNISLFKSFNEAKISDFTKDATFFALLLKIEIYAETLNLLQGINKK